MTIENYSRSTKQARAIYRSPVFIVISILLGLGLILFLVNQNHKAEESKNAKKTHEAVPVTVAKAALETLPWKFAYRQCRSIFGCKRYCSSWWAAYWRFLSTGTICKTRRSVISNRPAPLRSIISSGRG